MTERDHTVDILRGMAIFAMVAANMAAHSLQEPHPFGFRLYGSFAAPAFIFLAGMMVSLTRHYKQYTLGYYILRGSIILLVAALIDIFCWGVVPFVTFDVLYLIGIALPLACLFLKLNRWLQVMLLLLLFLAAPLLQHYMGYQPAPVEPEMASFKSDGFKQAPLLRQFLIDGWFPVFPWLGVALAGAFAGTIRIQLGTEKANSLFLRYGILSLVTGSLTWWWFQPQLPTREGYSELFYPPTLYYLLSVLGVILILLALLYPLRQARALLFFSVYGRSSLLMYILHTIFIVSIINVCFGTYSLGLFLLLYLGHALVLWLVSYAVQKIKKGRKLPFILGFLLGG